MNFQKLMQAQQEDDDLDQDIDRKRPVSGEAAAENARALHGACWKMRPADVEYFVSMADDLEAADDEFGYTPLHVAAIVGSVDVLEILLNARAYVDSLDRRRQTPLMRAAARGNEGVARALVLARADLEAMDQDGMTPLSIATFGKRASIQELLLRYDAPAENLATARDLGRFLQQELNLDRCGLEYAENMAAIRASHDELDTADQHGFMMPPGSPPSNGDSNEA